MAKLKFDETGARLYETGVKECVLYPFDKDATGDTKYTPGVNWNGITGITNKPSGAEATALWADDRKYANLLATEEFGLTIEAYTYPDAFMKCDGSSEIATGVYAGQQGRQTFGLAYKTGAGDDTEAAVNGKYFKLHLVYGCTASPSERAYSTMNDSPEAMTMSWEVETTPETLTGFKPVSHIEIDSRKVDADKLQELLDMLYGTDDAGQVTGITPHLPMPSDIADLFAD